MADRRAGNFRFYFMLGFGGALLLTIVSITIQFILMHNMDHSQSFPSSLMSAQRDGNDRPTSQQSDPPIPIIAYTVTLTGCGGKLDGGRKRYTKDDAMGLINQGAAVLAHSIKMAHAESNKYGYKMYALVHPSAKECSANLPKLGYTVLIRNTPFDKVDIQKTFLRENIGKASCCGEKEFVKMWAYTLVHHPVAVVLDLDSLVLRPLDHLFDAIIEGEGLKEETFDKLPIHEPGKNKIPKRIDAFYTKDYNMVNNPSSSEVAGVQGGFLIIRPSEDVFDNYIDLVLEGNYIEGRGWGGKYGYFFGGAQVQGICAYYYSGLHPERGVELNRCKINSMVDNPVFEIEGGKVRPNIDGKCRDGRVDCEDCRETDLSSVLSSHFTICGKPWTCSPNGVKLCQELHGEWFRIRRDFEKTRTDGLGYVPELEGSFRPETFHGYCKGHGGYVQIKVD
mmetsp:Transcript_24062/g.58102  ORF Transcript_24062/g.58102 Transcript_24062/m.58102 type:complete len:450 (+) Transcript_24062:351-1700(+)